MFTNRIFTVLVILVLAAVIVLTVREAMATSAVAPNPEEAPSIERSRSADTARWEAIAEYYQSVEEAHNLQRGRAADAARWTVLAHYYQSHPELRDGLTKTVETASEVAPIDECFDVSLSELDVCREASQAPAP
ncbi:MAG TPA: hypothetical protein VIR02_14850 [Anaerolineales bacterium]